MIALLYIGDYAAVQHLLKRIPAPQQQEDTLLEEWTNVVAMPILQQDSTRALQGLQHVSGNSPPPFHQYAGELASMYLQRQENEAKGIVGNNNNNNSNIGGHVVAFLEATQLKV